MFLSVPFSCGAKLCQVRFAQTTQSFWRTIKWKLIFFGIAKMVTACGRLAILFLWESDRKFHASVNGRYFRAGKGRITRIERWNWGKFNCWCSVHLRRRTVWWGEYWELSFVSHCAKFPFARFLFCKNVMRKSTNFSKNMGIDILGKVDRYLSLVHELLLQVFYDRHRFGYAFHL